MTNTAIGQRTYKMISWNVNGLRACCNKGFLETFAALDADIFAIQESKLQEGQIDLDLPGYYQYWNYAEKKGYSGTAVFCKEKPLRERYGFSENPDNEGRITALEFEKFWFVDVYTPNAQAELARLDFRMAWDDSFRDFLHELEQESNKPVITCGDFNCAHEEIDLKNPKSNRGNAGFSDEEREKFTLLLNSGFTDTFRHFYPTLEQVYSWWSYRRAARQNNAGWRIDYFLTSTSLDDALVDAKIHTQIMGSDHCPVELKIAL